MKVLIICRVMLDLCWKSQPVIVRVMSYKLKHCFEVWGVLNLNTWRKWFSWALYWVLNRWLSFQMNALHPATVKHALSCRPSTQNAPSAPALLQLPTWQQLWIMGASANHLSRHNPRPKWKVFSFIALYREMTTIHQEELKRFLINSSESKLPSSKAELFVLLSTISSWTRRLEAKAVSYKVSRATPQDTLVTIRTGWRCLLGNPRWLVIWELY